MMLPRFSFIWVFLVVFQAWVSTMVLGSIWFESPAKYMHYRRGESMMIRLVSDTLAPISGEIQMIDQNGFLPRDLGKIGIVNETHSVMESTATNNTNGLMTKKMAVTYSYKVWDQLPEGFRYQLVFLPYSATHGSNAVSYYFSVANPVSTITLM